MIIIFDNCGNLFDNCDDWDVNNYNDYNDYDDVVKQPARVIGDDGDNHWNNFNNYNDIKMITCKGYPGEANAQWGEDDWNEGESRRPRDILHLGGRRNTAEWLKEILLTDWEKYSWKTGRNIVDRLREILLANWEKYIW